MEAFEKVSIEVDYDRPYFKFPDLSSEQGNPREYFKLAINQLRRNGFKKEALDLEKFQFESYEKHFDIIARFLDFYPANEVISKDDDFVYLRVKKEAYENKSNIKQINFFNYDIDSIELLNSIIKNEDISVVNCYGRNILYYLDKPEVLEYFIEQNKEHNYIDLIDIDYFNSPALYSKKNVKSFGILLNALYEESPEIAQRFLTGKNVFGLAAINTFANEFSNNITVDKSIILSIDLKEELIKDFIYTLNIINKVDSSIFHELQNLTLDYVESKKNNKNYKEETKSSYMSLFIEATLLDKNNNPTVKKPKL